MVLYVNLYIPRQQEGKKVSELNGSKHSPNLICSQSLRACIFDLLVWLPNSVL
jgi:hypothetical protein